MFFSLEMLYIKCVYVHAQIPNVFFFFLVFKVLILE